MDQDKNCKSCHFGRENTEQGGLNCYLNPPVALTVSSQPVAQWGRPPVKADDECKSWSNDQD